MNLVEQYFPQTINPEEQVMDNILVTMDFWKLSKKEFDELTIPEYLVLRDHAFKVLLEQKRQMDKLNSKGKR